MGNCELDALTDIRNSIKELAKGYTNLGHYEGNVTKVIFLGNSSYKNANDLKNSINKKFSPKTYKESASVVKISDGFEVVYKVPNALIKAQELVNNSKENELTEEKIENENKQELEKSLETIRYDIFDEEGNVGFAIATRKGKLQFISKLVSIEELNEYQKQRFDLKEKQYLYTSVINTKTKQPVINNDQQDKITQQLTGIVLDMVADDLLNGKAATIFYKEGENSVLNVRKFLIKRLTELNNKYKEKTIDPKELEEFVLLTGLFKIDDFLRFQEDIINRLKAKGYKFEEGKLKINQEDEGIKDLQQELIENDNEDFEMSEDITGKSDQFSDYSALTTSNKEKMSGRLRTFLSSIKSEEPSLITLTSDKKVYNTQYVTEDKVIQAVNESLVGINDFNKAIKNLDEDSKTYKGREFLTQVKDRLLLENEKGSEIVNQFVDKFNQQKNNLTITNYIKKPVIAYTFTTQEGKKVSVPLRDGKNNVMFYYDYRVINANRNDIATNLKDDAKQNFIEENKLEEEIVPLDITKFIFDDYVEFKEYAKNNYKNGKFSNVTEAKQKLKDLFSKINITLSEELLEELTENKRNRLTVNFNTATNDTKSVFHNKFGILSNIFSELNNEVTLDKLFGNSGVNKLFKLEAEFQEYYYNISTLDGKGRNIWGYSMPSPFFRSLFDILNDEEKQEIAANKDLSYFTSSSYILEQLSKLNTEERKLFKENLKYSLFNTLKTTGTEGKELTQMKEQEFIISQIISLIGSDIKSNNGVYWSNKFLTTPSDKSTMYLIQTPNQKIPVLNGKVNIKADSEINQRFFNYFEGEYRRAIAYQNGTAEYKQSVDDMLTYEPMVFYNFSQLNIKSKDNPLWKKDGDTWILRDLDEEVSSGITVEDYVKLELSKQLQKEIETTRKKLENTGVISNGRFVNGFPNSYRKRVPESVSLQKDINNIQIDLYTPLTKEKKDIKLKELKNTYEKSEISLTDYLVADYALNYLLHNIEMSALLIGDPAQYLKNEGQKFENKPQVFNSSNITEIVNYIDGIRDNMSKRMAGLQANRMEGNITNFKTTNTVVVDDIVTPSKILSQIQKFTPEQTEKYANIQSMDGAGIITAEEDLRQKLIHGKIDQKTYQSLYDKVQKQHEDIEKYGFVTDENKFNDNEKLIAQPIKPVVFGNIYDSNLKIFKTTYYKDSEFALYPELTENFDIDKIRKGLYNLSKKGINIDRLVTKTGTKLGAKKPISGIFNPDMSINQEAVESITQESIDVIPRSMQGIQLEIPYEPEKSEIRIASQQVKLIFNEIQNVSWSNQEGLIDKFLPELKGKKVTGKLLKTYHNNVYKKLVELSLEDVLEDIGIDFDINTGTYTFENLEKLQKTLVDTAIELGYSKPSLEGLSLTSDKKEFIVPISFNESSDKLEKLLLSLLNKAILQKIHGRSFILAPEMGFVPNTTFLDKLKEENKDSKDITEKGVVEGEVAKELIKKYSDSIVFTKNFDFKQGLLPSRRSNPNEKNSEILPAQVLVSWKFKGLDINDFTRTDEDGRIFIDESKMNEDVLRILGIRIPTHGHSSMASIEIVGFLPAFMGDMIVAPQDFVAMMGSDFDIDKLYGYTYNYEFTAKDGLKKLTDFNEEQYRKDNAKKKLISDIFGEETTIEKEIRKNKKKVLQNKLQDIYHTIMLHPNVLDKSLEGITEGRLGELAAELKTIKETKDFDYYSPSSVTNKIDEYFENKAGKLGVGVFSVNSTFLTIVEGLGLELQKSIFTKDEDGNTQKEEVPDTFIIKDNQGEEHEFYKISASKGVNRLISMFQSASVDNAKLKYLNWIGVNKDTMGVAALLSSLADDNIVDENGVPVLNEDYIVYFLSQPIIQEYIKLINANNSFSDFVNTDELVSNLLDSYKDRIDSNLQDSSPQELIETLNTLKEDPNYTLEELKDFVKNENDLQDDANYLASQYRVLNKFLALKEQADVMRSLQYLVNADSKGVPSSLAEANYKETRKNEMLLGSPYIKNVNRVFENIKDTDVEITENQDITGLENMFEDNGLNTLQGYIANIANDISVKVFSTNNAILASGSEHIKELVETLYKATGRKSENYSYKFVNKLTKSYLAFLQSSSNLQIQDRDITFKEEIKNLLSPEIGLADAIAQFKSTSEYKSSSLLKPFFESLKTKNQEGLKFVEFKASQGLVNTDEQIVQGLNYLRKLNTPLFNQLIKYALLVKIENSPVSFKKFIPIYYKEAIGLTDSLRELNNKLNLTTEKGEIQATLLYLEADVLPIYAFSEQFLQHYPEETKSLAFQDFTYLDNTNKPTDEITENINVKGEFRAKYTGVTEGKEFYLPYLSVYNYEEKKYNLFKKLDNDGNYTKIPNLGQYNIDEFNADTKTTATSILPKNQVKSLQTKVEETNIPSTEVKNVQGENITSKGSEFAKKLTNVGNLVGLAYKGKEYVNSEHAYQTWKSGEFNQAGYNLKGGKVRGGKIGDTFFIMTDILTEKLKQHPELVQGINERGGLDYLQKSTHNVIGDKFWESTGQNKFIEALIQAYKNINTEVNNSKVEVVSKDYGVVQVETNPTKEETEQFVDLLRPQIQKQTYKENKGKNANEMFHYGLMWARTNKLAKPVKINAFDKGVYYAYHELDQNQNKLPDLSVLQPIINEIQNSLGLDMLDYDSVIGNIYLDDQYIYPHKDTTESVSARNYPVIVYTLGNDAGLGIVDNNEGKMTFANQYDKQWLPAQEKLKGYTNELQTKNGSIYTFGLDGNGRFELTHSTPMNNKKMKDFPPITLPNGKVVTKYTITLTFRRAKDLDATTPITPKKLQNVSNQSTEVENKTEQLSNPPIRELGVFINNEEAKVNNILAGYGVTEEQTGEQKVKTIFDKIAIDSKSPYFSELAKLMLKLNEKFEFTKGISVNLVKDQDSHYDPNTHTINLNTSQTDKFGKPLPEFSERMQYEILHELLHSLLDGRLGKEEAGTILKNRINRLINTLQSEESLQKAIDLFELKDKTGNTATVEYLLNKLQILREESQDVEGVKYVNEDERSVLNPLINEREFLVNVLGDNNTRMWMNEIPYDDKSVFDKLWEAVSSFFNNLIRTFGFDIKDKSTLQEALKVVFDVINYEEELTPVEGKPISKLTGVNNANIITATPTTKEVDISTDYFKQRLERLYQKKTKLYANKTLTEQEKLDQIREVDVTIARIQQNVDMLENNFTLSEFFRVAQKELIDLKQILRDYENLSVEDANQAVQIFNYFDILYAQLNAQNTNFYDDNYTEEKVFVSPELMFKVEAFHNVAETLKANLQKGASKTFIGVYNSKTGKTLSNNDFFVTEKSSGYRKNVLATTKSKQQSIRAVSRIVTEVLRDTKQAEIDHEQEDLSEFREFEKEFSFKDLMRFINYTDPNGVKRNESTLISRYNLEFFIRKSQIFKDAQSFKDPKEKSKFIKEQLSKISYDVDIRYLFPDEYTQEMRDYYNDNNIEWLNTDSRDVYYDKFLNFHKDQFSEFGDDYAEYRLNSVIEQARQKVDKYFLDKEVFIDSLDQQKLSDQEKKDRLQDWISYNSPFLLLNELIPLKKEDGALTERSWETPPQEVNIRTFTTKSGKVVTERPFIDFKNRHAKNYVINKAKNKNEIGDTTGFYDAEYMSMEQEYLEKENNILLFEAQGDITSAEQERNRKIKWEYLKFIEERQKYYLEMLPHYLTKDLKWYNLIDVSKDYKEQFSDVLKPFLKLDKSLLDFSKTDLLKLMSLGWNFIFDKVVKTLWDSHIGEREQYIDFITKQIKLSYNPSGTSNSLNKADMGDLRTTDVFNYFAQLRNAAINYRERNKMEELIKLGQYLNTLPMTNMHSKEKNIELEKSEMAALNWTINSKIYGSKREELYLGTEHLISKKLGNKYWQLTKAERDKLTTLQENLSYYESILPSVNDVKAINQINEKIFLINRQIDNIKRERTKYTWFNAYSKYVSLKYLSFGIAGRFADLTATSMGAIKTAIDGRIYGLESYRKAFGKVLSLYAPNAASSMITASGVVSLNLPVALTGVAARMGTGVANQTFRAEEVAKINQLLYRLGALEYLNYSDDDNVSSFVTKQNLSEEFMASLKTFSPFSTIAQIEIINKGIPSIAVMYEEKLQDKKGNERPLLDAFTVDENLNLIWNTEEFEENSEYNWYDGAKMRNVVAKVLAAQTFSGGDYDTTTAKYGDSKLYVRALMMLRRFMGEFINTRIGTTTEEETTGLKNMGTYRGLILTLKQFTPYKNKKETAEQKQIREIAAKQITFDIVFLMTLSLVIKQLLHQLAKASEDDEDFKDLNWIEQMDYILSKNIDRIVGDNLQFLNPDVLKGRIAAGMVSPLFSDVMQVFEIVKDIAKSIGGDSELSHREMISKGLAPRNRILYQYEYDDLNNPGKKKTKTVYQDPVTGAIKQPTLARGKNGRIYVKQTPLGKYSKNYEKQSRLSYNIKRFFPFFNLHQKHQRQQNEIMKKADK